MEADNLKAMSALVKEHFAPTVIETAERSVLVTTTTQQIHDLEAFIDKHRENPKRAAGTSKHDTIESLTAHARRHMTGDSVLFCGIQGAPTLHAIYNYQPRATDRGAWRDHGATYAFPLSDAWKRWTAAAARPLSVLEFAELIENGIADVADPSQPSSAPRLPGVRYATPAELLTLSEGLAIHVDQVVVEQRKNDNGTSKLQFAEEHDTRNKIGEAINVPNGFLLGIQVYLGGPAYAIPCRLRYRIKDRAIVWVLQLHDVETAKRDAVTEAARAVAGDTGLPLFFGSSE